jgi:cytochrome c peroxidase
MRATGRRLGNPAAEQAEGPPTNPVEMGLPDIACAVYRASQRPYRARGLSIPDQTRVVVRRHLDRLLVSLHRAVVSRSSRT